jgi:hypothetical protein
LAVQIWITSGYAVNRCSGNLVSGHDFTGVPSEPPLLDGVVFTRVEKGPKVSRASAPEKNFGNFRMRDDPTASSCSVSGHDFTGVPSEPPLLNEVVFSRAA